MITRREKDLVALLDQAEALHQRVAELLQVARRQFGAGRSPGRNQVGNTSWTARARWRLKTALEYSPNRVARGGLLLAVIMAARPCFIAAALVAGALFITAGADTQNTLSKERSLQEIPTDLMIRLKSVVGIMGGASYTVTIYGDGRVVYWGADDVRVRGEALGHIENAAIIRLLQRFEAIRFFDLEGDYRWQTNCREYDTDAPWVYITLSMRGRVKTVVHDLGCKRPDLSRLEELEQAIDREAGIRKWVE